MGRWGGWGRWGDGGMGRWGRQGRQGRIILLSTVNSQQSTVISHQSSPPMPHPH
ncbi:hypothetical protein [Nostoc linckia]|uniref:hypothetical protein n=1 Tax=Nostoc linckia TaxID=92942 RepID=UPI0015D47845|nr:hypothetical protein [Nostoc linckia]